MQSQPEEVPAQDAYGAAITRLARTTEQLVMTEAQLAYVRRELGVVERDNDRLREIVEAYRASEADVKDCPDAAAG